MADSTSTGLARSWIASNTMMRSYWPSAPVSAASRAWNFKRSARPASAAYVRAILMATPRPES